MIKQTSSLKSNEEVFWCKNEDIWGYEHTFDAMVNSNFKIRSVASVVSQWYWIGIHWENKSGFWVTIGLPDIKVKNTVKKLYISSSIQNGSGTKMSLTKTAIGEDLQKVKLL